MYLNWTFCAAWCLFGVIFSHCSQLMRVRKSSRVTASTNTKLLLLFKQLSAHVHTTHTSQCRSETSSSRLQQRWVPHCALWMNDFCLILFVCGVLLHHLCQHQRLCFHAVHPSIIHDSFRRRGQPQFPEKPTVWFRKNAFPTVVLKPDSDSVKAPFWRNWFAFI